ncbi:purine-nucleoside phosphorylase [Candidatus Arthromitus sp. SFB-rat-Yit]|uniref:purine-nucleoside phosphorylase n=1 Tax=Candidatus Arthromitus sp. SFB-rat-Yit TaxID=1041504 RepID=UPI000227A362|nr:purine-nucleoside phosphorylase [Candidatus Arthromitus sp. SFB-rat-Yit]BAK80855.1 purine nucleoside phosphorylase [Candidatus Arthromitus sp. SFB-rat-Yit]
MNTPHINTGGNKIAESILLPGDPLRCKFIAENYLTDVVQFNSVRNMLGFTGKYKGKEVSVMGTGMGMPSIGIYSYELITKFEVKNLIRIGSCGAIQENLKLYDIVIGQGASTNSNFASQYGLPGTFAPIASYELLFKAVESANKLGIHVNIGNILSSDIFYDDNKDSYLLWKKMGVLAIEMEAAALYMNAARLGAKALCILTVSDSIVNHEETTAEERQTAFHKMMEISLDMI